MDRAYSTLIIKSIDDEQRIIEGIASTPTPDRTGDIVEPKGAKFNLPLPFLFQHDKSQPIGHVIAAEVTDAGIRIKAQIAKNVLPSIDNAWALIKAGLVRGLSVGFKPLTGGAERLKDGSGIRFKSWEWLELSAVTVAAHQDASIHVIKAIDSGLLAALGTEKSAVVRLDQSSPGASGKTLDTKGTKMKTTAELIRGFEEKRAAVVGSMTTIMEKSAETGSTLDPEQKEQYDGAAAEIKEIDEHLVRLKAHEATMLTKATPITVTNANTQEAGSNARGGVVTDAKGTGVITVKDNLPPGIEFARYAMCLASAEGNKMQALEIAKHRYPDNPRIEMVLKAAVAGGTTTDTTWASPLVQPQLMASEFVEFLRPQTILGKFGANGIPSLRRVPFNIKLGAQTSGGAGYWVGEGAPKPLTKFDFASVTMGWTKIAAISVLTEELVRFSSPSAETLVRDALSAAIIERMDIDFIDPAHAAVAGVSPASITNGVTGSTTAGNEIADIATDVRNVFTSFINVNLSPTQGVWIMSALNALALSQMVNPLGQPAYPGVTLTGGTFAGLPVIVSQYVPTTSGASPVILVNTSDIFLADDGQVDIKISREASLQMLDNPTNNSATATATTMVSMFQTNSLAILAERFVNWQKRRAGAVAFVAAAKWGQPEA